MRKLVLLFAYSSLAIACGSPATSGTNSAASKTNVNAANKTPYSQTENAYTFAQISDLAYELGPSGKKAREIVGKTVTESKLWQNKKFDRRLTKLMESDYVTMKRFWNVETPIKKFGDFLMMTGCEQRNCGENQYVIFIDLGDGRINVIHIGKDAIREWSAGQGIDDLPPPFEEELKRMRSRK